MTSIDPLTAGGVLLATALTDAVYVMFTSAVVARNSGVATRSERSLASAKPSTMRATSTNGAIFRASHKAAKPPTAKASTASVDGSCGSPK